MKRRLFNALAGLSLLLCIATGALWVRSYWGEDYVRWQRPDGMRMAMTLHGYVAGALYVGRGAGGPVDVAYIRGSVAFPRSNYTYTNDIPGERSINWELGGFGWHEKWQLHDYRQIKWIAPFWGIFLATAALPVAWTMRFRSRLRARRIGLCRICGYDLRATPDRCPECGTEVTTAVDHGVAT